MNAIISRCRKGFHCIALALPALALLRAISASPASTPAPTTSNVAYDIRADGAVGDGVTLDTMAIQTLIDRCNVAGGGTVHIAGGPYVTGTLYLKSNVCLHIDADATLLGSPRIADYTTDTDRTMYRGEPYMNRCLIFARNAANITIEGPGAIDGQGVAFPNRGDAEKNRPKMIRLMNCTGVRMHDIHLEAPASWTNEWRYCDDIDVHDVTIHSRAKSNGDGLDFDGCTKIRVRDCTFDTSDDSICLQTSLPEKPCRNVSITHCHFSSRWAGIRIGLLSRGDFEDVHVSACIFDTHNDSGIKIQMNEGAEIKNMSFTDLTMKDVPRPVLVTFCQKNAWVDAGPDVNMPPMKRVSGLRFEHIKVETTTSGKGCGFIITGMPDHPLEDITFSDITATFPGGGTERDAKNVLAELTLDRMVNHWPEYSTFSAHTPAFGIYARHVNGLTLDKINIKTSQADGRPPIVLVDVTGGKLTDCPQPERREH
jgi:Glycosyl hydrolases family 28